jgi:hypothetical protein
MKFLTDQDVYAARPDNWVLSVFQGRGVLRGESASI